jgi:hypothetical protein
MAVHAFSICLTRFKIFFYNQVFFITNLNLKFMRKVTSLLIVLFLFAGGIWGQVPGPNLNEGFEDGIIPDNWTIINVDGGAQVWNAQTTNPHTGLYSARVRYETSSLNNDDWLITPPLYVTSATTDEISFWLRTYSATYADPWEVLVSTTNTNPASFTMIDSGPGMLGEYVQKTYSLDEYGDAVVYVAIRSIGAYDWYVYVDDFTGPPVMVPTCPKPTDLTAENPTINSIELGWTAGNTETMWDVLYGAAGFDPETEGTLITGIEANPYLLENLASSTVYEFYVRAVCGEDEVSLWAGPKLFNTLCTSVGLPLIENFTFVTTPALPLCWSKIIANTNNVSVNIETTTLYPVSPPYAVKLYNSSADTAELLLITPEISDPLAGNRVMFSARGGTNYSLLVGTISDPADPATFTMVGEVFPTGTHTPFQVSLADYTGTDTYIAFKHGNMGKTQTIYIDDIVIEELPDCIEPINLTVSGITNNTAVLGWTAQGSETTWDVVYGAPGFDPLTAGTTVTGITANPYTLTGLASATTYEFYVRADCGTDEVSTWSGPLAFTTLCDAFELPFLENFDGAATGSFPLCWSKQGLATTNWSISNTANALGTAPELRFGYSPSFTGEALAVSPVINTLGETSVAIEFKHFFDYYTVPFTFGMKTTSDGVNWNTIWEVIDPTANVGPETLLLSVDNGDVGSATFQFAFFVDGYTFNMDNWYMDDIHVFVPEFGTLEGTVTEATRGPVEGALITAEDYQAYTDASGYYIIENMMTGTYDVTCEAIGYFPVTVEGIEIMADQTTTQDFALGYATISVTPESLSQILYPDETATQMLTISNADGTEPLTWSGAIELLETKAQQLSIPAVNPSDVNSSRNGLSKGKAPFINPSPAKGYVFDVLRGTTGHGFDMYPGQDYINFDTDAPGTFTFTAPSAATVFAADFDGNNVFYAIDNDAATLNTVDLTTGAFTLVGNSMAFTDMAFDYTTNTMYAIDYDDVALTNDLYTVDLATGAATLVGSSTGGLIISMACDGNGDLYGFEIQLDEIVSINKTTGARTSIGAAGFDGNYAQSMAWDPASNIIYMAAYNNTASQGQLRVVDIATGATSLVGVFPGGAEVCGLGFMGAIDSWLSIEPLSGIVAPGETQDVTVSFDATDLTLGTYHANIKINHNGQELTDGTVIVPVTMTITEPGVPLPPFDPSPESGATMVSLQPVLSWTNGAGTSEVQVELRAASGPFGSLVYKSEWFSGSSIDLADVPLTLLPNKDYSWRVFVKNSVASVTGPKWTFKTAGVGTIEGIVTNATTTEPLEGVTITTEPEGYTTTTSATGTYSLSNVLEGTYMVTASLEGYLPESQEVTVENEQTTTANFELELDIPASGTIAGTVTDALTRDPVGYVTITVDELRYTTTTDENGYYELEVPTGDYLVTASKPGYISQTAEVTVIVDETITQDFLLEFAGPVLLYADGGFGEINLGWTGNPAAPYDNATRYSINNMELKNGKSKTALIDKDEQAHGINNVVPQATSGRAVGDDCDDPIILDMTTLPVVDVNTTCGRGNNYTETCLGNYDNGEDIVYQFTLSEAKDLKLILTTVTSYTGMLITQECPISLNCVTFVTGSGGNKTLLASLEAGTYYIMIDTWAAPDCIPEFTLTIDEYIPQPGEICATALDYGNVNDDPELGVIEPSGAMWYSFTADQNYGSVDVSLCGTSFDSKLEVWYNCDDATYAYYNDDSPACDTKALQSFITTGPMQAGQTWYAKVYAYSTNSGDYILEITGAEACALEMPAGAIAEGEPCIEDEGEDVTNGGCNMVDPMFTSINCGDVIWGSAST